MTQTRIAGVIAAVPTPVDSHGDIDGDAFPEHARWCLRNGCDFLNVLGTTGEANSLSATQRSARDDRRAGIGWQQTYGRYRHARS